MYIAGQMPRRSDGTRIEEEPFEVQARQVLDNLEAVAKAAHSSLRQAVKVCVYLRDTGNAAAFDAIYKEYVGDPPAARTTVQSDLPRTAALEVDAVCLLGEDA